jgi:hypothetical protein
MNILAYSIHKARIALMQNTRNKYAIFERDFNAIRRATEWFS